MAESQTKRCCHCKQVKLIGEFSRNQCDCRACAAERYRAWRLKNREHHAARNNKWYHAHKDRAAAGTKKYRALNAESLAADKRVYHEENAERIRAKVRAWQRENPDKRRVHCERRRARKRSLPDDWTVIEMAFALKCWGNACAACRMPFGLLAQLVWDHWIPLVAEGCPGTVVGNMIPLCRTCNSQKGDRVAAKWLKERFKNNAAEIARRVARYFASAVSREVVADGNRV